MMAVVALALGAAAAQEIGEGVALVPVERLEKKAPVFYSTEARSEVSLGEDAVEGRIEVEFRVHQGEAERLELGIAGEGEVLGVTGGAVRDWSVRSGAFGLRVLEVEVGEVEAAELAIRWRREIREEEKWEPFEVLVPQPAKAVGFSSRLRLKEGGPYQWKVLAARGMSEVGGGVEYLANGDAGLRVELEPRGLKPAPIELLEPRLSGELAEDGESVSFTLNGAVRVNQAGAEIELFRDVAVSGPSSGDNWHLGLERVDGGWAHVLRGGESGAARTPLAIRFEVPVRREQDWRVMDFRLPAGVVVPLELRGLGEAPRFDRDRPLVPRATEEGDWRGFLNAAGEAELAWQDAGSAADGALFFAGRELAELRVGAGLLRQDSTVTLRVLQGRLERLQFRVEGEGEVLAVEGEQVLGWSLREEEGERTLEVELSRPIEGEGALTLQAQAPLGSFPVKVEPMRFLPVGALRHSGHLRLGNEGAVRLEVIEATGMMQLSPEQFPGAAPKESLRQVFVYRFPSADYEYRVAADQVLPEVGVSEVTVYEMGESDRRIVCDLELDIREAPLREWTVGIPADFAVAEVGGASVADYNVASEAEGGRRDLKVLFSDAVIGRQLVVIRLERNLAAKAGEWVLPTLAHEEANSVRGFIGVASAPGFRVLTASSGGLAEVPVDFFPKQVEGLQQAFRIRESPWAATMRVEALGQSVQADVFHLYSLKEGIAYGSVVVNYFVVGAPASEWRLRVPEAIGNVEVTGQRVGRDWRREGDLLIVPLTRPVMGLATILVTFEQPMSARGGEFAPGELRPLEVQSERGYIQVTSPLQVNQTVTRSEGSLLRIDPSELPAEYQLLSNAPTLAAWQYTTGDPQLAMKVEWYEPGETASKVVEFSSLDSRVSRDGQVVTTARMFARTRGGSNLELELPPGAELWEARVGGQRVNARVDGETTLVPLGPADPQRPVEVMLRYGEAAEGAWIDLQAPVVSSAVAVARWSLRGDEDRQLVPRGGNAELVRPAMTETGFEWVAGAGRRAAPFVLLLAALGVVLSRLRPVAVLGLLAMLGAVVWSFALAVEAGGSRRPNLEVLDYSAPAVLSGEPLRIEVANLPPELALVSLGGILAGVLGIALLVAVRRDRLARHRLALTGIGLALIGYGLLAQRGGAVLFFGVLGVVLLARFLVPWSVESLREWRRRPKAAASASLLLAALLGPGLAPRAEGATAAEQIVHQWTLGENRLEAEMEVVLRADEPGERFLLLRSPAVLSGFEGEGLEVVKEDGDYFAVARRAGALAGEARYELAVADPAAGWKVPSGAAAVQRILARHRESGWEFVAEGAARRVELDDGATRIELLPGAGAKVRVRPRQRDASAEASRFFSEVSDLFVPGPGVVSGIHRVSLRPSQGVLREVVLQAPEGFTVGEVRGPVTLWRFNPESGEVRVRLDRDHERAFELRVMSQRATGVLPVEVSLEPLRVVGSAGSVGMLGLAFGGDSQPEAVESEGMGAVNLDDFPRDLIPTGRQGEPLAVLQQAFRYGAEEASLSLRVAPVAPELRAEVRQTLSLGNDRVVVAADLGVRITRAGVFKLELELPEGFDIDAVSGAALSHWTDGEQDGLRVVTLHLNGRTIGRQDFTLSLSAPAPGTRDAWSVPRLTLGEATRQRGTLTVVPERGLQVRAVDRTHVSQLDPETIQVPTPGALAFRLLQGDWELTLAVRELDPWVTAQVLHELTLREGQRSTRLRVDYRIENAARKSLRVRLPGLDEAAAATVRAKGPAVADFVALEEEGLWELRFQRGVAGATRVEIEFQQASAEAEAALQPVGFPEVRQLTYFVGLRTAGRLDAAIEEAPRGWQQVGWSTVPGSLREGAAAGPAAFTFRVAEPEGALRVRVERHELADALRLRIASGRLTTALSSGGASVNQVRLAVETREKDSLRLMLPPDATLFSVMVNGVGVPLVREGEAWMFHVQPSPVDGEPARVSFTYSLPGRGEPRLEGPRFGVPLEDIEWLVYLPDGWELAEADGDFQLVERGDETRVDVDDYRRFVDARGRENQQREMALRDRGFAALAAGEQEKASQLLNNVAANGLLDEASNEDVRVQVRNLKMQQAVLGLNTRRQRNYLDNRFNSQGVENRQLEQAAQENPILQGGKNFDPQRFDQLFTGNTAEETSSLKEISGRIVSQQLQVESAPETLDVALLPQGRRVLFARSLQVDGSEPTTIEMELKRERPRGWVYGGVIGILAASVVVVGRRKS